MYEYRITKVVKIVDGDTFDAILDLGFGLYKKERIRVAGVDVTESRTRDMEEKQWGMEAKEWLTRALDTDKKIRVRTEKDGKFGRMLGWIFIEEMCVNTKNIQEGFAWYYDGGSRLQKSYDLLQLRRDKHHK